MKKVAIVIGHGPNIDRGAVSEDGATTELDWNRDLASRIQDRLSGRVEGIIVHRVTERLQPVAETNATEADAAIELHLNSTPGASGTEMIIHESSTNARRFGQFLLDGAVRALGLPDRGVKGPQGGGRGERWLVGTRMPAVIVESFFIDTPSDLDRGNERKDELASAYADAIVAFLT